MSITDANNERPMESASIDNSTSEENSSSKRPMHVLLQYSTDESQGTSDPIGKHLRVITEMQYVWWGTRQPMHPLKITALNSQIQSNVETFAFFSKAARITHR